MSFPSRQRRRARRMLSGRPGNGIVVAMATTTAPATVVQPLVGTARAARVGRRTFTTPTQLRIGLVVLVAATAVFGLIVVRSVSHRLDAARAVGLAASPQLVAAQDVYVKLADADATASSGFLNAGKELPALQQRYRDDIDAASRQLPAMAQRSGSVAARNAVTTITDQLPVYTGLVEAARANNRQALPVAGAYLHEASQLMRNTILPAATTTYEDAATQLADGDRAGSGAGEVTAVGIAGVGLLFLLILMLIVVASRTRRIINVGLAAAVVVVVALLVVPTVAFARERDALRRSQTKGSDPLQVLSTARILALRTFSDENLDLIDRGATSEYMPDFARIAGMLQGTAATKGLLAQDFVGERVTLAFRQYLAAHHAVRSADAAGEYTRAVFIATSAQAAAMQRLDTAFQVQVNSARARLERQARDARNAVRFVAVAAVILAVLAAVSIVLGLQPRIREYA